MQIPNIFRIAEQIATNTPPTDPERLKVRDGLLELAARGLQLAARVSQPSHDSDELPRITSRIDEILSLLAPSAEELEEHRARLSLLHARIEDDLWLQGFGEAYNGRIPEYVAARTAHRTEYHERIQRRGDPLDLHRELALLSAAEREALREIHPRLIARVEWTLRRRRR